MATTQTTTLRVPIELRDEIAHLAASTNRTMVDVVSDAIRQLARDEWWGSVRDELDAMTTDDRDDYRSETDALDVAAGDGVGDH